jgi:ATP-dependent protease HslVU (ClpYQ) ATPase subunit
MADRIEVELDEKTNKMLEAVGYNPLSELPKDGADLFKEAIAEYAQAEKIKQKAAIKRAIDEWVKLLVQRKEIEKKFSAELKKINEAGGKLLKRIEDAQAGRIVFDAERHPAPAAPDKQ